MISPAKHYQRHVHSKLQRLATWEPGDAIAVGDIGVVNRGGFRRMTSLAELGIPCEVIEGETRDHRSLTSQQGVDLRADASAKVPRGFMRVFAGLRKAGTVLFEARKVQQLRLGRQGEVIAALREIRDGKRASPLRWDRRWVCVDQVWRAERGTVIVATGSASEVGLTVRADALPEVADLASLEIEGKAEVRGADVYKLLGAQDFTPYFTAWTFNLWGKVKFLSRDAQGQGEELQGPPSLGLEDFLSREDE